MCCIVSYNTGDTVNLAQINNSIMNWQLFVWHWVISFQGLCILGKCSGPERGSQPMGISVFSSHSSLCKILLRVSLNMKAFTKHSSGVCCFSVTCCWRNHIIHSMLIMILHNLRACSLLPLIIIGVFPFPGYIVMCFALCVKASTGLFIYKCIYPWSYYNISCTSINANT